MKGEEWKKNLEGFSLSLGNRAIPIAASRLWNTVAEHYNRSFYRYLLELVRGLVRPGLPRRRGWAGRGHTVLALLQCNPVAACNYVDGRFPAVDVVGASDASSSSSSASRHRQDAEPAAPCRPTGARVNR